MKLHTFLSAILSICSIVQTISAQDLSYWVKVSPSDEQFSVMMPQSPESKTQKNNYGPLEVDATLYSVKEQGVSYNLWSLKNRNYRNMQSLSAEEYLDDCADLVSESLLKLRREKHQPFFPMFYQHELQTGGIPGREYLLREGEKQGLVRVFVKGEKIYVLAVFNSKGNVAGTGRFLGSFEPDRARAQTAQTDTVANTEQPTGGTGRAGGPEREKQSSDNPGGATDYDRIFDIKEVTVRARLLSRPPPGFTDTARKYHVTGTVVLRAVLSKTGEVTDISVVKGLPHGLTRTAIEAIKLIKFTPATKDGIQVSQRVQVEYHYNLY